MAENLFFAKKPLEERIVDDGIGKLLELVLKQRSLQSELAALNRSSSQENHPPSPEARVAISRLGFLSLTFTEEM